MKKLIVAFRNFENAPKITEKKKVNRSYNITILSLTTFLQKRLLPPNPRRVNWDKYAPHFYFYYHFSKKKKQRETIKLIPHLAFILVPKNGATTKIKGNKYCGHERVKI